MKSHQILLNWEIPKAYTIDDLMNRNKDNLKIPKIQYNTKNLSSIDTLNVSMPINIYK